MSEVFSESYAGAYDLVYQSKSYRGECDLIEAIFREKAVRPVRTVLDLGCGTGGHAIPLAARGYRVTGVDRSEPMLEAARRKLAQLEGPPELGFVAADIRDYRGREPADAVVMMFAVLGYLVTDADQEAALATVRANLVDGGLFVFDGWYGPAVERQGLSSRHATIESDDEGELRRVVSGALDRPTRSCVITIELQRREGDSVRVLAHEDHRMRYFDRSELARRLSAAGLEMLQLTAFPSLDSLPDETTWNVLGVARAGSA